MSSFVFKVAICLLSVNSIMIDISPKYVTSIAHLDLWCVESFWKLKWQPILTRTFLQHMKTFKQFTKMFPQLTGYIPLTPPPVQMVPPSHSLLSEQVPVTSTPLTLSSPAGSTPLTPLLPGRFHAVPGSVGPRGDALRPRRIPSGEAGPLSPAALPAGDQLLDGRAQLATHLHRAAKRTRGGHSPCDRVVVFGCTQWVDIVSEM